MTGLLTYTELNQISFIELVHCHEMMELKMQEKASMFKMIGDTIGGITKR